MALYRLFLGKAQGSINVNANGAAANVSVGGVSVVATVAGGWTVVGSSLITTFTGTTWTPIEPPGVTSGDLFVACIATRFDAAPEFAPPSGWTVSHYATTSDITVGTSGIGSAWMAFIVRGSSTPSMTFTFGPGSNNVSIGQIWVYRGAKPTSTFDDSSSATTAVATTAISATGLTTTVASDLIVAVIGGGQAAIYENFNATNPSGASGVDDSVDPPSSTTWGRRVGFSTTTGSDTALAVFDAIKVSPGATGNFTATASLGAGHAVVATAFRIGAAISTSASVSGFLNLISVGDVTATTGTGISASAGGQGMAVSNGGVTVTTVQNTSTVTLGNALTSAVGIADAIAIGNATVTTDLMTSSVGTVTVSAAGNTSTTVSSHLLTSAVGAVTVTSIEVASVTVTGNSMTSAVGIASITAGGSSSVSVSGNLLTANSAAVDDIVVGITTSTSVTGQALTASVGSVSAGTGVNVASNGFSINAAVGSVITNFSSNLDISGLLLDIDVGQAGSTNWGVLPDDETETWVTVPYDVLEEMPEEEPVE